MNLTAGEIGRLSTAASLASTDNILVLQSGKLFRSTPNQVVTNSGNITGSVTYSGTVQGATVTATSVVNTPSVNYSSGGLVNGTTAAFFNNSGLTYFGSSVSNTFSMTTPTAGLVKYLGCANGTAVQVVTCSGANVGSTTATKLTFAASGDGVALIAVTNAATSALQWIILAKTTGVTLS